MIVVSNVSSIIDLSSSPIRDWNAVVVVVVVVLVVVVAVVV